MRKNDVKVAVLHTRQGMLMQCPACAELVTVPVAMLSDPRCPRTQCGAPLVAKELTLTLLDYHESTGECAVCAAEGVVQSKPTRPWECDEYHGGVGYVDACSARHAAVAVYVEELRSDCSHLGEKA